MKLLPALVALALATAAGAQSKAPTMNGFTLEPSSVPLEEILRGGPGRDGIPALDSPAALPAAAAQWHDDEIVMGVEVGSEARAYPVAILNWHELVNDALGGQPILVTYCPLCGTGLVFDRRFGEETRRFGVSGLLYKSDVLFFDRESESLWSQIEATAITGPAIGTRLRVVRSRMMRWGDWRKLHPQSSVLSLETGHQRDYARDPYGDYATSERVLLPAPVDPRYHPKMPTVGIRAPGGSARAYPADEIERAGGRVEERFEGRSVAIVYHPGSRHFEVDAPEDLEVVEGFWFAWAAFHPETSVFESPAGHGSRGSKGINPP
jgi:hypothetical protein